jgi:hypothetical protein
VHDVEEHGSGFVGNWVEGQNREIRSTFVEMKKVAPASDHLTVQGFRGYSLAEVIQALWRYLLSV